MSSTPQPQEEPTSAEVPKTLIVLQVVLLLAIAYLVQGNRMPDPNKSGT